MFAEHGVLNYQTYLVGVIFIMLAPRPNTLSTLGNGASSGMKSGYLAACGVFIGDIVLMFLARTGVVTLIKTTPVLFNIVRYLDAFYLFYLRSKTLYATLESENSEARSGEPQCGAISKHTLILNLTNPKTVLFYVSFFVQFIGVNAPHMGISFSILAVTPGLVGSYYLSFPIISGASVTWYIRTKKKLVRVGNSLIGLMFVGLAARLAALQS